MGKPIKLPILVYHRLIHHRSDLEQISAGTRPYCLPTSRFIEHLDYLNTQGYRGISVSEIYRIEEDRTVGITFDDGMASDYYVAFPELEKAGFKATFYIVTDFIGKAGYMNWNQIKELQRHGFEIGSHSVTHPFLSDLGSKKLLYELCQSKRILEDHLGKPIKSFGVPRGYVNSNIIEAAFDVGYQTICTSTTNMVTATQITKVYGRYGMRRGDSIEDFKGIVGKKTLTILKIISKEKGKSFLKRCMGRRAWLAFRERVLSKKNL